MPRNRTIDRALNPQNRAVWIATGAILLLGIAVILWVASPTERRRMSLMDRVDVGDPADRIVQLIGPPTECPPRALGHLHASFPEGWPLASREVALERMARETRKRWVYSVDRREPADCSGSEGQTEVGVDAEERVLWYVTITGKSRLQLPEGYAPADAGATS